MKALMIFITLALGISVGAEEKTSTSKKAASRSTDIRFNGTEVGGMYQSAGEALATVEKEKSLIDLIEPRREFKDRLRKSVTQR